MNYSGTSQDNKTTHIFIHAVPVRLQADALIEGGVAGEAAEVLVDLGTAAQGLDVEEAEDLQDSLILKKKH